jgi:photosystem II stability/assembly factor-like uncharacterized protein
MSCSGLPAFASVTSILSRGTRLYVVLNGRMLYNSNDSGNSWRQVWDGPKDSRSILSIAEINSSIYATDWVHVYRSSNEGLEWNLEDTSLMAITMPQVLFTFDSSIYAAGNWVVRKGKHESTWSVIAIPPADSDWSISTVSVMGSVFFAISNRSNVLRSTDSGKTWNSCHFFIHGIQFLTTIGHTLFAGGYDGISYSKDSARTWQKLSPPNLTTSTPITLLSCEDSVLFVGYRGIGMFRSLDDGFSWKACNHGLYNSKIQVLSQLNGSVLAGGTGGLYSTSDNGITWNSDLKFLGSDISSIYIDELAVFIGRQQAVRPAFFYSSDSLETWHGCDSFNLRNVKSFVRSNDKLIAGGDPDDRKYGLYQCINGGSSWKASKVISGYIDIEVYNLLRTDTTVLAATNGGP